jgi:multidrug efflux pump subunit AcrA (membrane-fusion protein)
MGGRAGAGLFARDRVIAAALGLLAIILAVLIARDVLFPAAPAAGAVNTLTASLGTVRAAVSATGTVVPATQQNVGFSVAGTLTEVDVKPGDRITAGQTLAKIDTTTLQQALDQANNTLAQAQATLNSTLDSNAVTQAQHGLAAAQQSYSDTVASVNLTNQQDATTLSSDQNQFNLDSVCASKSATCDPASVGADKQKITTDQLKIQTDQLSGQKTINQAANAVTTAQDQLNSQTISRPNTIASQQAAVSNDQLAVQTAQRNLNAATLTAPIDGTVFSVTGQVGENVSASGGSTALAPGSTAPQPSSTGATSTGNTTGNASSSSSASSGGSAFAVIGNLTALQVVAPFAEGDASKLAANQQATVTFDAVAGLTVPAHVLAVSAASTVISNVTNYYATLVVDNLDPRLKSGMTANASVIVQQAQGVIALRNTAITRIGQAAFVTLVGADGKQTRQPVQLGAVGDQTTEIVSGVNAGDKVVVPQLRVPTQGSTGGGRNGGNPVRIGGGGSGG